MVIRPANQDTTKRGEFVKGEKKRQTERGEEGSGGGRTGEDRGPFSEHFPFSFFFFKNQRRKKRELRKLYMWAKTLFFFVKIKKKTKKSQH